jgi:CBS domain-containing protein
MSPRAACRLETLGFEEVYDYVTGKADWLGRGLPTEREEAGPPRVADVARQDVVTCGLETTMREIRDAIAASPYGFALVVSQGDILLGRLRRRAWEGDPTATAEQAMEPGPSTVRPATDAAELLQRLQELDLATAIVTTPEGRLMGVVRRADLEQHAS